MRTQANEALRAFNLIHNVRAIAIIQDDFIRRNTRVFWWQKIQYQVLVSWLPTVVVELDEIDLEMMRIIEAR
ncbi:hypothetical protein LEP3755_30560 [Leptolyngbya sp. NIES-3755]|nr:hypothetical protein LEP3755_30560 [Leptolyngbya sp. NIES-3755]